MQWCIPSGPPPVVIIENCDRSRVGRLLVIILSLLCDAPVIIINLVPRPMLMPAMTAYLGIIASQGIGDNHVPVTDAQAAGGVADHFAGAIVTG